MSRVDPRLLARFLRQLRELGETELFLEALTRSEALEALRGRGAGVAAPGSRDTAAPKSTGRDRAEAVSAGHEAFARAMGAPAAEPVPDPAATGPVGTVREGDAGDAPGAEALRQLGERAAVCTACRLHEGRRNVVFGDGGANARVVVVGEAPGAEEDRTGRPFVGPAGKLLDLLLASVGFPREQVYICNVLKCRPPGNRDPRPDEVTSCAGYLHGQLEAIGPRALLAVGRFAAQTLLGRDDSLGRLRGEVHAYRGVPLVVTYHPAFLLRSPHFTRTTWEDLQLLRKVVDDA